VKRCWGSRSARLALFVDEGVVAVQVVETHDFVAALQQGARERRLPTKPAAPVTNTRIVLLLDSLQPQALDLLCRRVQIPEEVAQPLPQPRRFLRQRLDPVALLPIVVGEVVERRALLPRT